MLMLNATLERTEQPPLKQGGDLMNAWQDLVGQFEAGVDHRDAVGIADVRKSGLAFPAIGMNGRARLDRLPDELPQALGGDVIDAAQSDTTDGVTAFLGCQDYDGLALGFPASLTFFRATHIGLVNLDFAGKPLTLWPHHGPTQLV